MNLSGKRKGRGFFIFILIFSLFLYPVYRAIASTSVAFAEDAEKLHATTEQSERVNSETVTKPKVMVLVGAVETSYSIFHRETDVSIYIENVIEAQLMLNKFTLISPLQSAAIQRLEHAYAIGDSKEVGRIAENVGVDVIIFVEVLRQFVDVRVIFGRYYMFFSNHVSIKAISANSGQTIYSGAKNKHPTTVYYTEPLKDAAIELTKEFVGVVTKASTQPSGQIFKIKLTGISFKQIVNFQKALKSLKGIEDVERRAFQDDTGMLEVVYDGDIDGLINLIFSIEGLKADVLSVLGNEVLLSITNSSS